MRIALFDYAVIASNPIGSCHLRMLRDLSVRHEFTVFAAQFDNPSPGRIRWVRVPVIPRPLILLFISYFCLAPVAYAIHRLLQRSRFDLIQMVESTLPFGDVCHAQFCHRAYLKNHWRSSRPDGLRRIFKWLDHKARAAFEPGAFRRARCIIVPSRGLERDILREYPFTSGKIRLIPNFVETGNLRVPATFDRSAFRERLGVNAGDSVLIFVALGHFERKGLPQTLAALQAIADQRLRLLVVGGSPALIGAYRRRADKAGLNGQVIFTGMQQDVRAYLWAADAFVFPTAYEACSLAAIQAAAAGLPLLSSPANGIEDLVSDGRSGFLVGRSADEVAGGIRRLLALPAEVRSRMGRNAQIAVEAYSADAFIRAWGDFYEGAPMVA